MNALKTLISQFKQRVNLINFDIRFSWYFILNEIIHLISLLSLFVCKLYHIEDDILRQ